MHFKKTSRIALYLPPSGGLGDNALLQRPEEYSFSMSLSLTHTHTSATCQKRPKKVAVDDTDDDKRGGSTILNKRMDIFATLVSLANEEAT